MYIFNRSFESTFLIWKQFTWGHQCMYRYIIDQWRPEPEHWAHLDSFLDSSLMPKILPNPNLNDPCLRGWWCNQIGGSQEVWRPLSRANAGWQPCKCCKTMLHDVYYHPATGKYRSSEQQPNMKHIWSIITKCGVYLCLFHPHLKLLYASCTRARNCHIISTHHIIDNRCSLATYLLVLVWALPDPVLLELASPVLIRRHIVTRTHRSFIELDMNLCEVWSWDSPYYRVFSWLNFAANLDKAILDV